MMKKKNKLVVPMALLGVAVFAVLAGVVGFVKASSNNAKYNAEGNMIINEAPTQSDMMGSSSGLNAIVDTPFPELALISAGDVSKKWINGVAVESMPAVGAATTTMYFKNESGTVMYIDSHNMFVQFKGTASSTFTVSCGTSTYTGIAAYTTTPPANIIAASTIVTSTVGASAQGLVQPATTMAGLHYLANNESVICGWYNLSR